MELMQSDVFVRSTARRLFALLTAAVAFAIPPHVPIALRTLDALLIRPQPGALLTIAEGGERAA
jgi:hypothetical protein